MKTSDCQNLYRDGRHYDLINRDISDDIPYYFAQMRRFGEPILELASGTGRITIPALEAGFEIMGLDLSMSMLCHAKKKAVNKRIRLNVICADCRSFALKQKFKLIIFPFNALTHIQDLESMEAFLSCVREHLSVDGRFIIDVFNPRYDILIRDPLKRYIIDEYPDPDGRGTVVVWEKNYYDTAAQINHLIWYFCIDGDEIHKAEYNMRIYYHQELDTLLRYNGFAIEAKYGYYDGSPFTSKSRKQIVVCRKK